MLYQRLEQLEQRIKETAQTIAQLKYDRMEIEIKYQELEKRFSEQELELQMLREERDKLGSRIASLLDHFDAMSKDEGKEPPETVGILEDSFVDLERQVEQDSENFVALFDLGVAYERKGMFEEAIAAFERAIKANPNYASAMEHLAFLLEKLNREKEALPLWEKVLTLKK
jgi:tetratricopeptide (TPR) repeat protein